jgi:pyridinium-3,5-biscarboxylic acid mononucleotide sulfurtransferase
MRELTIQDSSLRQKWQSLIISLKELEGCRVAVAFSGGVDSALLATAAFYVLGDQMVAITIHSPINVDDDLPAATQVAAAVGFRHKVVQFDDLQNPAFIANTSQRCYHCKRRRFEILLQYMRKSNIQHMLEGSNADDEFDYRPGKRAVNELRVLSPLVEASLSKTNIRQIARNLDLAVWDRPSAPCLATRIPYGTPITSERIALIADSERFIRSLGFTHVRARLHEKLVRIEVPEMDINRLLDYRSSILAFFEERQVHYVTLDLQGYRTGSMNEVMEDDSDGVHATA